MSKLLPYCIFAILLVTNVHCEIKPKFYCNQDSFDPYMCVLQNLYLTRNSSGFTPVAPNASKIQVVQVNSYKIDVLTSDICNTFPNIRHLILKQLEIKDIEQDAFANCTMLASLELQNNSLVSLDSNIFANNKRLKSLYLSNNPLVQLDIDVFKGLRALNTLELENNFLLDLDVETLFEYTSVKNIWMGHTHILCERFEEIDKFISNSTYSYISHNNCLEDDQYEEELMKINVKDVLVQAKLNYLFKKLQNTNSWYDWKDWHLYIFVATGVFLILITLVSLILCCTARCELRRQNNRYSQLQE